MAAIIRYGMVGGGMKALIGEVHRKALKFDNRVELVAGCFSSHADRNAEVGVEYGLDPARVYANYEEMAKAEAAREDGIDFVSICTPNFLHYEIAKEFLLDMSPAGGQAHFRAMRKLASEHASEKVGKEVRSLYSWSDSDKLINN